MGDVAAPMDLRRTVIVGNSGAGKSWLAARIFEKLKIPAIDLDDIHWQQDGYNTRTDEALAAALVREAAEKPAWIIEGVYGRLAKIALPHATSLIWLDLAWEECHAALLGRDARWGEDLHNKLIEWAGEYWSRDNFNSYDGHFRLFEEFKGAKLRLRSRSDVAAFAAQIEPPE